MAHLDLVRVVARQVFRRLSPNSSMKLDDLVAAGHFGLLEAANRFDVTKGKRFPAYAEFLIKGAIIDELRAMDSLSRDSRILSKRILKAMQALRNQLNRNPTAEEIAAHLGWTLEKLYERQSTLTGSAVIGFDDVGPKFLGRQRDADATNALDLLLDKESRERVRAALSKLPERHRRTIEAQIYDELTLRTIGRQFGVTESRACQIVKLGVAELRALLKPTEEIDIV